MLNADNYSGQVLVSFVDSVDQTEMPPNNSWRIDAEKHRDDVWRDVQARWV